MGVVHLHGGGCRAMTLTLGARSERPGLPLRPFRPEAALFGALPATASQSHVTSLCHGCRAGCPPALTDAQLIEHGVLDEGEATTGGYALHCVPVGRRNSEGGL